MIGIGIIALMTEESATPEAMETRTAASVAIENDQVILVREEEGSGHITGVMGLPSGRVNEGETELDAAVREFREETGLIVEKEDFSDFDGNVFHATVQRKDGNRVKFRWQVFRVNHFRGELATSGDNVTPIKVSLADLEKLEEEGKLLPNVLNAINAYLHSK